MKAVDPIENTPHVTLMDHHNNAHVIPVSALQEAVEGKHPVSNLGDDVLRRIVEEWLELLGERKYPIVHRNPNVQGMVLQYDSNVFIWHTLPTKTRGAEQRIANSLKRAWAHRLSHLRAVKGVI